MSRIKLRNFLNLTEQAPQPASSEGPTGATGVPPSEPNQTEKPQQPTPNVPQSGNETEYDFTKDFREFEDKIKQAENEGKKEFLDKINKMVVGKKITANASRGYGQPKTDQSIEKVKKISLDFYYDKWVVVVYDDNDKKYFLTPGINIKIEGSVGSEEEPVQKQAPQEPNQPQVPTTGEQPPKEVPAQTTSPSPQPPKAPIATAEPETVPPAEEDPRLKKKQPVAENTKYCLEWIQADVGQFLSECVISSVKDQNGKFDVKKFVVGKPIVESINEETSKTVYTLELPANIFERSFDPQDLKLTIYEGFRSYSGRGQQFTNGSVDIQRIGRIYRLTFEKRLGWDV